MAAFDKITNGDQSIDSGLDKAGVQQISREAWESNLSASKPASGESKLTGDTLDIPPADFGENTTMGTMSADTSVAQSAGDAASSVSKQAEALAPDEVNIGTGNDFSNDSDNSNDNDININIDLDDTETNTNTHVDNSDNYGDNRHGDCDQSRWQDNCGYDRGDDWGYDYEYRERGHGRGHGDRGYDYGEGGGHSERELSNWFNGLPPQEQAQLLAWLSQEHANGGGGYGYNQTGYNQTGYDQTGYGQPGYGGQPSNPMDPFNLMGMFNQYNRMMAQQYTELLEPWMPLAQEVAPVAGDFTGHAVGGAAKAIIAA